MRQHLSLHIVTVNSPRCKRRKPLLHKPFGASISVVKRVPSEVGVQLGPSPAGAGAGIGIGIGTGNGLVQSKGYLWPDEYR